MTRARKVGILNLGCPRNLVDAENILGRLSAKGYRIVDIDKADVAIINTCAFIDEAKKESVDAILDLVSLKKEGKLKKIIVAGCLPQRYKAKLSKELPEIDAFVGKSALNHGFGRFPITPPHYGYLKICEGCVHACSYCVIPKIKGRFTSMDIESISERLDAFDKQGVSELNIIGQDITGFGLDLYGSRTLPELLEKIVKKAKHIGWIRLLYLYPHPVILDVVKLMKRQPKICRYIDLPIQHINNRILKLMNRRVTKKDITELIGKIRKELPDAAIRTCVIVGFPSETESEFKELLDFIGEARFERLGAFEFSREEGAAAYSLKGQHSAKIKRERLEAVMQRQQKISEELNKKFLGQVIEVLVEEKDKEYYLGRSRYDAPEVDGMVYVKPGKLAIKPGDFVKVKVTDTLEYDLVGEVSR